jgi:hypothetical protein
VSLLRRGAAAAAGVIAALAIAAPVAGASAAKPRAATKPRAVPFLAFPFLPAFIQPTIAHLLWSVVPPTGEAVPMAGPLVVDSVFNGPTAVVVSNAPAVGSVTGSP